MLLLQNFLVASSGHGLVSSDFHRYLAVEFFVSPTDSLSSLEQQLTEPLDRMAYTRVWQYRLEP